MKAHGKLSPFTTPAITYNSYLLEQEWNLVIPMIATAPQYNQGMKAFSLKDEPPGATFCN